MHRQKYTNVAQDPGKAKRYTVVMDQAGSERITTATLAVRKIEFCIAPELDADVPQ